MTGWGDGLRLAVGTLTIVPVAPPRTVDRRSGSWAMTFAPLVGLLLAVPATALLWLLGGTGTGLGDTDTAGASPLLVATLTVGLLALLTRAIHLDGLADTVDGLGSGRPAEQALGIMRRSDIGPFGVVALVLVLALQVVALAELVADGRGAPAVTCALVLSRLTLPAMCARGIPAARGDGLGRAVAGTVSAAQLALAVSVVVLVAATTVLTASAPVDAGVLVRVGAVTVLALAAGAGMCLWCVRRLGGVTGDTMGACVEATFTVALVAHSLM